MFRNIEKEKIELKIYPDNVLRKTAYSVNDINEEISKLVERMAKIMYKNKGVGLAAPQVGIRKRVIVFDYGQGLLPIINPEIVYLNQIKKIDEEGCLSFPTLYLKIQRKQKIIVKGLNLKGKEFFWEFQELPARIVQHEIDHLDGKLIIDQAVNGQEKEIKRYLEKVAAGTKVKS